jgi:hypothetical protein
LVVFLATEADWSIPATRFPGKRALVIVKPAGVVPSWEAHVNTVESTATFIAGAAPTIATSPTSASAAIWEAETALAAAIATVTTRAATAAKALAPLLFFLPSPAPGIGIVGIHPDCGKQATEQNAHGAAPGYPLAQPMHSHRQPIEGISVHCMRLLKFRLAAAALHSRSFLSAGHDMRVRTLRHNQQRMQERNRVSEAVGCWLLAVGSF